MMSLNKVNTMNAFVKCPQFRVSREANFSDKAITITMNEDDLVDDSIFYVMPVNVFDAKDLIRYIGETYHRYQRILKVDSVEDVDEYLESVFLYSFKISIRKTNKVIEIKDEVDRSILSLQVKGACQNSIFNAAKKLTGNIGVHFSREEAIDRLFNANDLISASIAEEAVDRALSLLFSRVKLIKSISESSIQVDSAEEAFELINENPKGIYVLKSPTGTGKTSKVLYPLHKKHKGNCTYVVHRRSIARSAMPEMAHYEEDVLPLKEYDITSLKIVVNSLIRENLKQITQKTSLLLVDEAQQTLGHIVNCYLDDEAERALIFNEFLELITNSEKVVMADADVNDNLLEFIKLSGRGDVSVIEVRGQHSNVQIRVNDFAAVKNDFYEAVSLGDGKALLATDNARMAEGIHANLVDKYPNKKILLLTKNNVEGRIQKLFVSDPNNLKCNPENDFDVIIYSPVITSALSIEVPIYKYHFGLFENVILGSDALQMLRRDRTARLYRVGLKNCKVRNYSAEDKARYMRQFEGAEGFDRIAGLIDADALFMRSHFVTSFIHAARLDGFEVIVESHDSVKLQKGRLVAKVEDKLSKEAYVAGVMEALQKAEKVNKNWVIPISKSSDYYATQAKNIANLFGAKDVSEEDIEFFDRGSILTGLRNLDLVGADEEMIRASLKEDESKFMRAKEYADIRNELFSIIFITLNIDIKTGEGFYTEAEAKKLLKILHKKSREFNKLSSEIKSSNAWGNARYSVRTVNKILRHFFKFNIRSAEYTDNKIRKTKYYICPDRFALMTKLLNNNRVKVIYKP